MSGIIKVEPRKKTESPVKVTSKSDIDSLLNVKKDCYAAIEKMEEQTEEFKAETQTALNQIDLRLAEADTNIEEAKKAATDAKEIAESLAGVEERVQGITAQAKSDMNDIKQATEDIKTAAAIEVTNIKDQAVEDTNAIKEATEEIKLEAAAARNDAIDAATLSESWAKGGTGTRADEDTNNAKYWAEKAAEVAKVEIATTERAGIVKPDGTTIEVEADGTIRVKGGNYVPASEKGTVNGVATLGADGKVPTEQLPKISSDAKDITYKDSNVESALDNLADNKADKGFILTTNLAIGSTEVVFTDERITEDTLVEIYTSDYKIAPIDVVSGIGTTTVTFEKQNVELGVKGVFHNGLV